ncbi:MAG: HEAT repeat domain-containing protein [Nitrospirae bacterium]|nr:HEAT repeat domain-containing protein [Nitrospirota bacterium]
MQDLRNLLKNADIEIRREALETLKGKSGEEYVNLLLMAMEDTSWRVRNTAIDILLEYYPVESYIHGLIQLLYQEHNAGARNSAIEVLIRLNKKVTPYLIEAFNTPNRDVRKFIIDILGGFKDTRSIPLMLSALKDDDENVRATAIEHIGKIRESSVINALIEIIESDDIWTSYPATDALGRIGDRKAIPALRKALEKKTLRAPAIKSLSLIADNTTLQDIIPYLKDNVKTVQEEVLLGIVRYYHKGVSEDFITGEIRRIIGENAIDYIIPHTKSNKYEVKASAILLLGLMKDNRAYNALLEISQEENFVDDVKRAFVFIGKESPESLLKLFETDNIYQKRIMCEIASCIASPVYYPILEELLKNEDGHIRSIAATGLSKIGDPKAMEPIKKLLNDPYEDVQEAAVEALSRFRTWLSVIDYINLLRDRNPTLRKNAALILGKIDAKEAIPALEFALKDSDVRVRKACVEAFSLLKTKDSVKSLILALTDEDPQIRISSALNLGSIGGEGILEALSFLISDPVDAIRVAVSKAFGMLADKRAVQNLIKLLSDKNGFVVTTTIESLSKIGGNEAKLALLKMIESPDKEIKRTAIKALASFEGIEEKLFPFLKDHDWATRMAAVEVLGQSGKDYIRKELEKILDAEEDPIVKRMIQDSLEKTKSQ